MENYECLCSLGVGSNGNKVFKVQDKKTGEIFAMKAMTVTGDMHKFNNEILILKSLNHPNIVRYVDSFLVDDTVYIVMEFASKGDLNQHIRKVKEEGSFILEDQIWKWFFQLASALQYIHSHKILHRDIKVHNAFISGSNEIKLGDFGISKLLECTLDFTYSTMGTPFYLSPEICLGVGYNYKTDIWMLGCLLYELCSLSRPYHGESIPGIINNIKNNHPSKLNEMLYSQNLINLIMKMLSKSPDERPSISELLSSDDIIKPKPQFSSGRSLQANLSNGFLSRSFGEKKYLKIDIKNSNMDQEQEASEGKLNSKSESIGSIIYRPQGRFENTPNCSKAQINTIHKKMKVSPVNLENNNRINSVKSIKSCVQQPKMRNCGSMPRLKSNYDDYQTNSTAHISNKNIHTPNSQVEPSPLNLAGENIYYKKYIIGNANYISKKEENSFKKLDNKEEIGILKPMKGHIKHISMDISSTIQSPNDDLHLKIKVEHFSNVRFQKTGSQHNMMTPQCVPTQNIVNMSSMSGKKELRTTKEVSKINFLPRK